MKDNAASRDDTELGGILRRAPHLAQTVAVLVSVAGELNAEALLDGTAVGAHGPVAAAPTRQETPAGAGWLSRFGSSRRSVLVSAVLLTAVVAVPTAYALRVAIRNLFEGTPAPPAISTQFADANAIHDAQAALARQDNLPNVARWKVDVSRAHGIVSLQTADGLVDLWAAPEGGGGQCWILEIAVPSADPPFRSAGSCDSSATH